MFGLLNIHKPAGITSRDVVNRVQKCVRPHKAGHAGTLDPLATGVLVVCIGQATRLIEYVQRMPKRYLGTFLLGRQSETEDTEGTIVELANPPRPDRETIERALTDFVGEIQQMPPAFSALKVAGKRAYNLARKGVAVELQPRPVIIHSLALTGYDYPELALDIRCGSGTYVRSLGRDIARSLGTEAVMSALVRQEIGLFRLSQSLDHSSISPETIRAHLRPAVEALPELPRFELTAAELAALWQGRQLANRLNLVGAEIAAVDPQGSLAAILTVTESGALQPLRVFPQGDECNSARR
jgi:tRNA pseudouridine55 synthase